MTDLHAARCGGTAALVRRAAHPQRGGAGRQHLHRQPHLRWDAQHVACPLQGPPCCVASPGVPCKSHSSLSARCWRCHEVFSNLSPPAVHLISALPWPPLLRPCPDLNPLWMAAGAEFTLAGEGTGQRAVAASDFFLGYRKTALQPHEVLLKASSPAHAQTSEWLLGRRQQHARGAWAWVGFPVSAGFQAPTEPCCLLWPTLQVFVPFTRRFEYVKEFKQAREAGRRAGGMRRRHAWRPMFDCPAGVHPSRCRVQHQAPCNPSPVSPWATCADPKAVLSFGPAGAPARRRHRHRERRHALPHGSGRRCAPVPVHPSACAPQCLCAPVPAVLPAAQHTPSTQPHSGQPASGRARRFLQCLFNAPCAHPALTRLQTFAVLCLLQWSTQQHAPVLHLLRCHWACRRLLGDC